MKRLARLFVFVGLVLSLLSPRHARTQEVNAQAAGATHNHAAVTSAEVIDGAVNPELIPDLTAERLWLLAVSADVQGQPDKSDIARQSHLRAGRIADAEIPAADAILLQFRSGYDQLLATYNQSVAAGQQPSLSTFLAQRDLLVQQTEAALQSTLSLTSFSGLRAHIQAEKAHMKIGKEVK